MLPQTADLDLWVDVARQEIDHARQDLQTAKIELHIARSWALDAVRMLEPFYACRDSNHPHRAHLARLPRTEIA